MHVCVHVCMCAHVCVHACVCMCVCACVCMCALCMCVLCYVYATCVYGTHLSIDGTRENTKSVRTPAIKAAQQHSSSILHIAKYFSVSSNVYAHMSFY